MKLYTHHFRAMGSPCAVHLYADSPSLAKAAFHHAEREVLRLEHKYSRYRDDSVTARINAAAAQAGSIDVDGETAALLDYAQVTWLESDGLFDISSGVLREVWNFKAGIVPTEAQVMAVLPRVGWDKVHWTKPQLRFSHPGMALDFGGYVKEYGADCAAARCLELGVKHGLVELGGDIRVIGPHPDGRPWAIGIRHPRLPEQVLAHVDLLQGAIASSGDYERCIDVDGRRYGHVLDPRTGWPVENLVAVSVLADHCLLAGTATTVAMLRGSDGLAWLADLGLSWLAMDAAGQVHGSLVGTAAA